MFLVDILTVTSEVPDSLLKQLLNEKNSEGQTPLQLAAAADKADVVLAMMAAGNGVSLVPVLFIRIRENPAVLAGSESGKKVGF
jgi:ankyrin repeat protein